MKKQQQKQQNTKTLPLNPTPFGSAFLTVLIGLAVRTMMCCTSRQVRLRLKEIQNDTSLLTSEENCINHCNLLLESASDYRLVTMELNSNHHEIVL